MLFSLIAISSCIDLTKCLKKSPLVNILCSVNSKLVGCKVAKGKAKLPLNY